MAKFQSIVDKMANDDPLHLGSWCRDRVLGTGGFGIVTLWKNNKTSQRVAIKKCRWGVDSMMTPTHKERWAREVDIMQRLSHQNVVRAISLPIELQGIISELPLLCMEFCSGGDLRQILNKPENCCGLREAEVRCLLTDLTEAVQYLHLQRITHRDLKPENIVLQEIPDQPMIYKLIDLGYAKELDSNSLCSSFVGTMQYLAPEFFTSPGYSSSVDYWSLGLVCHESITGVRPFLPNAASPVQWIPIVEKKTTNDICIYEVPGFENEIKYSQQMFVENHISRCLREDLEKWLRLPLEWDPQKRGRSQPGNKLEIFSMLDTILSKKIVTVFCVPVLQCHSYQVDSATAVSTLHQWIERDTKHPARQQLLLLPSGKQLTHDKMAIDCWDPNEVTMLYMFNSAPLALPRVKVADRVPPLVRWLMNNTDQLLNYHHLKHIWRLAVFFLRKEYEIFQWFLEAYAVKMLSLMEQSHQLSRLEVEVSVEIEQLTAMQTLTVDSLELDNKCYSRFLSGIPSLMSLGRVMGSWAQEVNANAIKVSSYREAQSAIKSIVQKVLQCTAAVQEDGDCGQIDLLAFEKLLREGYERYENLRKQKDKTSCLNSRDMCRIIYKCFKQMDISLCNQSFERHLKQVAECEEETNDVLKKLMALKSQAMDCRKAVVKNHLTRQRDLWTLVHRLSSSNQKEMDTPNTSPVPNMVLPFSSLPTTSSPNISLSAAPIDHEVIQQQSQVSKQSSSTHLQNAGAPHTTVFDTSAQQQPLTHSPALHMQGVHKPTQLRYSLDSDSLIQDNINIRYAMQDSVVSYIQCTNSIAGVEFDWSYLNTFKK